MLIRHPIQMAVWIYTYESRIQKRGLRWGYEYKFESCQDIGGV